MSRSRLPLTLVTLLLGAVLLGGCFNEEAQQHREATKAIEKARMQLDALPPNVQDAAKKAQSVINALRSIDVKSKRLSQLRNGLTARAELTLGEAALDTVRRQRREAAALAGQVEARLLAMLDLSTFVEYATFRAQDMGADALQQDAEARVRQQRAFQNQREQLDQLIATMASQKDARQDAIGRARQEAHHLRMAALDRSGSAAVQDLEAVGRMLATLAPEESDIDRLNMQLEGQEISRAQIQLLIEGEQATIEAIESEAQSLAEFVQARQAQVEKARQRLETLESDMLKDAAQLAELETGVLQAAALEALGHFDTAAAEAQRAARAASRSGAAPEVALEVGARQAALAVAAGRLIAVSRAATIFDTLSAQGGIADAATWREHARALAVQRNEALTLAVETADAAQEIAAKLGDGTAAEAIRARIGTLQNAFAGRAVSAAEVSTPAADAPSGMPQTPTSGPVDPNDAGAVGTAFARDSVLAMLGDQQAKAGALAILDCDGNPALCEGLNFTATVMPKFQTILTSATAAFADDAGTPEAQMAMQFLSMLNPEALMEMARPMLANLQPDDVQIDGDKATVTVTAGDDTMSISMNRTPAGWRVTEAVSDKGALSEVVRAGNLEAAIQQLDAIAAGLDDGSIDSFQALIMRLGPVMEEMNLSPPAGR
jgi:PBP1b-binding outer membrane lipoprotein LpoB